MSKLSLKCYVCKFCDLKFKNESDLNLHNQLHASTGEFSCPLCKEIFPDLLQLQSHDLRHSLEETQDVSANESSAYITFLRPASSFTCTICNGIFLSDEELFEHVSHHEKVEIAPLSDSAEPCVEIKIEVDLHPSLYDDFQSLPSAPPPVNKHSNSQQMNKNECKTCKKLFNGPISLRRHQRRFHLNKKKFTCIKCHRMFLKLSILSNHTLQHHKTAKKEFSCHCCEKKFPKSVLLLKHIYVSHALQNKNFCHACFKFFADEDDLNSHMEDHIVLKSFDCGVCKKRYKTRSKLKRHRCISNGPRPYLCLMCGKRFLRIYHLERHYAMHKRKQPVFVNNKNPVVKCDSEITPYRCEKCEKYYKTESHLQRHRCNNDGLRPFQCNVCGKRFIRIYHLQRHADLHNKTESADETEYDLNYLINENPIIDLIYPGLCKSNSKNNIEHNIKNIKEKFECYICSKRWPSFLKYKQHFSIAHREVSFNACHICNKQFDKSSKVKQHLSLHAKEKTFKCDKCFKIFSSFQKLKYHFKKEKCEIRLACYQCPKSFKNKKSFQKHILSHETSKNGEFQCSICNNSFSDEKLLNAHILDFHNFLEDFQCHQCKAKFNDSYQLNLHMLVHKDLKRYKCFKCNSTFQNKLDWKNHILTHEETKPFPCYYCNKFFSRDYHRQKHLSVCIKR